MLTNGCTTSVQALETRVELIATSWNIGTFKADICSGEMGYIMDMVEIFLRDIFDSVFEHIINVSALLGPEYPNIRLPFARIAYR